jgi:hypothetical protein
MVHHFSNFHRYLGETGGGQATTIFWNKDCSARPRNTALSLKGKIVTSPGASLYMNTIAAMLVTGMPLKHESEKPKSFTER